jgi:hypothetical protein
MIGGVVDEVWEVKGGMVSGKEMRFRNGIERFVILGRTDEEDGDYGSSDEGNDDEDNGNGDYRDSDDEYRYDKGIVGGDNKSENDEEDGNY